MFDLYKLLRPFCLTLIAAIPFNDLWCQSDDNYILKTLPLTDLKTLGTSGDWQLAANTVALPTAAVLTPSSGVGVLYNPGGKGIAMVKTPIEHRDMYLTFEFMTANMAEAVVWLQGKYPVSIRNTWWLLQANPRNSGGLQTALGGPRPPRTIADKAPGLWQTMSITFSAPRFDAKGQKIKPAMIERLTFNGLLLQENVVLESRQTETPDAAMLAIESGDAIAFRNIRYALLNDADVSVKNVTYRYYEGFFDSLPQLVKPLRTGKTQKIDCLLADLPNKMGLQFEGELMLPADDQYTIRVKRNGVAALEIDGKVIVRPDFKQVREDKPITLDLKGGVHTFRLSYLKNFGWRRTALGFFVQRANARPVALHTRASLPDPEPTPTIVLKPEAMPRLLRTYYNYKDTKKTHVMLVGHPLRTHFAYDLNKGTLLDIWRGDFADVTDMWHERGEPQTASALGVMARLPDEPLIFDPATEKALAIRYAGYALLEINEEMTMRFSGYLAEFGYPIFRYKMTENTLEDIIRPNEQGAIRILKFSNPNMPLRIKVAQGQEIADLGNGLYQVDGAYFIDTSNGTKATLSPIIDGKRDLYFDTSAQESHYMYRIIF
jgi:Domain of Unknown Function (DUF1080)